MKQSRIASAIESVASTLAGFGISLLAQWLFLPLLGVAITFTQNIYFALIMTAVSIGRGYVLRRLFEFFQIRKPLSPAMLAVIAERHRQVEVEGWTPEHDDVENDPGDLARHGALYALVPDGTADGKPPPGWRWADEWWKPTDLRRSLVKACALILAEIEKFDRTKRKPREQR